MEKMPFSKVIDFDEKAVDITVYRLVENEAERPPTGVHRRTLSKEERHSIWSKMGGTCYLCRKPIDPNGMWDVDHVLAFSKDPQAHDVLDNMLPTHSSCNRSKSNLTLTQLLRQRPHLTLGSTMIGDLRDDDLNSSVFRELCRALNLKRRLRGNAKNNLKEIRDEKIPKEQSVLRTIMEACEMEKQEQREAENIPKFTIEDVLGKDAVVIGQGTFGVVQKATMRISKKKKVVALKKLKINEEELEREAIYVARLGSINVVKIHGMLLLEVKKSYVGGALSSETLIEKYLVMEFIPYTLSETTGRTRFCKNIVRGAFELADAILHVHAANLIHRDIKPANVLVTAEGRPKLADFGEARELCQNEYAYSVRGTASFRAPETRSGRYTHSSDVYSYGKTLQDVCTDNFSIAQEDRILVDEVVEGCIVYDPKKRVGLPVVLKKWSSRNENKIPSKSSTGSSFPNKKSQEYQKEQKPSSSVTCYYVTSRTGKGAMHIDPVCKGAKFLIPVSQGIAEKRRFCSTCTLRSSSPCPSDAQSPSTQGRNNSSEKQKEQQPRMSSSTRQSYYVTSLEGKGKMHTRKNCHRANKMISYTKGCAEGRELCSRCKNSAHAECNDLV